MEFGCGQACSKPNSSKDWVGPTAAHHHWQLWVLNNSAHQFRDCLAAEGATSTASTKAFNYFLFSIDFQVPGTAPISIPNSAIRLRCMSLFVCWETPTYTCSDAERTGEFWTVDFLVPRTWEYKKWQLIPSDSCARLFYYCFSACLGLLAVKEMREMTNELSFSFLLFFFILLVTKRKAGFLSRVFVTWESCCRKVWIQGFPYEWP